MSGPTYPTILQQPFAYAGIKNTIPYGSSSPNASWHDGFPPVTAEPVGSGGVPPAYGDFQGVFYELSSVIIWANAGGQFKWDADFASAVGYPTGAILQSTDGAHSFVALQSGVVTNPDIAANVDGVNWGLWDGNVSNGAGNFGTTTGAVNTMALAVVPPVNQLYDGMEFVFIPNNTNTAFATLNVGTGAISIVRGDGNGVTPDDLVAGSAYTVVFNGDFVLKQSGITPAGVIAAFAGATAPNGWLMCNGASLLRTTYPSLFAAIGATFGAADGTHFSLPNLEGVFPLGAGGSFAAALGTTGGEAEHTLITGEIPSHDHSLAGGYTGSTSYPGMTYTSNPGATVTEPYQTGNTGGGGAHNNMPPYLAINFIIKT